MSQSPHEDGRLHLDTGLMRESLVSEKLGRRTHADQVRRMVPDVNMIAIGGRSIMDRGAAAILPVVEEIVECKADHRMIVGVGGGTRARHTQQIGLDLRLPNGGLARIVGGAEEQNRDILQFLLAPNGGIVFIKDEIQNLQLQLNGGMIPVTIGQPPYHCWEPPPSEGVLPENGPDVGLFLMAEVFGARSVTYVRDVDGVLDGDLASGEELETIPRISARDLLDRGLPALPVDRELLRTLDRARSVNSVRVINGLVPGQLRAALAGDEVGTLIHNDRYVQESAA